LQSFKKRFAELCHARQFRGGAGNRQTGDYKNDEQNYIEMPVRNCR